MTNPKPRIATLGLVLAAGALGLYLALTDSQATDDGADRAPSSDSALTAEAGRTGVGGSQSPALAAPVAPTEQPLMAADNAEPVAEVQVRPVQTGPLDELKQVFETEPRESAAADLERSIEAEFKKADVPAGLFRAVVCRSSVCRIQMRWLPERQRGYNIVLFRLVHVFGQGVGIDPEAPDTNGELPIDVYMRRRIEPIARPSGL